MRWDGQRVEGRGSGEAGRVPPLPGLEAARIPGLVRTVSTPEFAGIRFHEVLARSALNAVPAASRMPFRWTINPYRGCSHACVYCLRGDTPVLMADGTQRPIADVRAGDRVIGTRRGPAGRRYVVTEVLAHWRTREPAFRVTLQDGTELVAGAEHRFLSRRGWRHVAGPESWDRPVLAVGDELLGAGRWGGPTAPPAHRVPAQRPARPPVAPPPRPVAEGDRRAVAVVDLAPAPAGDERPLAVGAPARRGARLAALRWRVLRALRLVGPPAPAPALSPGRRVRGGPGLAVRHIEPLGAEEPMFDITTGTGDFIAAGVVSHNCFARGTHQWLELDTGTGFDREIVVKLNIGDVLRTELARPSWRREHVALGTNTDPYQRAEGRYRLMPGIIGALAASGTPLSVLTKGTLLRRDLPLLAAAARDVPVGVAVSLAVHDQGLHESLEPGTPGPRARLDLIRAVREAGLPCGVLLAPVLPGLTDSEEHLDDAIGRLAAAGATGVSVIPLHLRPGAREWFLAWLQREHPDLVPLYRRLYARGAYVPPDYRRALEGRILPLLARHGVGGGAANRLSARDPGATAEGMPVVPRAPVQAALF